jgi:hypothetical protein
MGTEPLIFSARPDRLTSRPNNPLFWKFNRELQPLGGRLHHVARAVQAYELIRAGKSHPLWETLPLDSAGGYFSAQAPHGRETEYHQQIMKVQQRIIGLQLAPAEEATLNTAVVLHDVGIQKEPGWDHDKAGAEFIPGILAGNPVPGVATDRVATLVGKHGALPNFGVDMFPRDLDTLDNVLLDQLFVLSCADAAARPGTGKQIGDDERWNGLTPQVLRTFEAIADRRNFSDPGWFIEYRLRHLFSPSVYTNLSGPQLGEFKAALNAQLASAGQDNSAFFNSRFLFRFENRCFPIFRELASRPDGGTSFADPAKLLAVLNRQAKELFLAQGEKNLQIFSQPDVFGTKPGSPARTQYIETVRAALPAGKMNNEALAVTMTGDDKYRLTIRLDKLG